MYNRYIRNDNGEYQRVPQQEAPPPPDGPRGAHREEEIPREGGAFHRREGGSRDEAGVRGDGVLRKLLDRLKLEDVDTGDLLLLLLLLLLFSEGEDEELLIALGLLLIL